MGRLVCLLIMWPVAPFLFDRAALLFLELGYELAILEAEGGFCRRFLTGWLLC